MYYPGEKVTDDLEKADWLDYDDENKKEFLNSYAAVRRFQFGHFDKAAHLPLIYGKKHAKNALTSQSKTPKAIKTGKLIPIVFSHGVCSSRNMHSVMCSEMAAHGYVVFALDHHDGTCAYTVDKKGKKIPYELIFPSQQIFNERIH